MPPMVRNVYNLWSRKQTDNVKENIDWSMSFEQVVNDQNEDALLLFQNKRMEHFEEKIEYATIFAY